MAVGLDRMQVALQLHQRRLGRWQTPCTRCDDDPTSDRMAHRAAYIAPNWCRMARVTLRSLSLPIRGRSSRSLNRAAPM